jgi:transketolase
MSSGGLRTTVLQMIHRAGAGYSGLCLAYLDILSALYLRDGEGRFDSQKPQWKDRDYVLVSDPAALPALYVCLAKAGFFEWNSLDSYGQEGGILPLSPSLKTPGVEMVSSIPGTGLSVASGVLKSLSLQKRNNRVFVILGDRDLQCGESWEAAMRIADSRYDKVTVICVATRLSKLGYVPTKFESFGWNVMKLVNGHDQDELLDALFKVKEIKRRPSLIWAPCILGKGVPFSEGKREYSNVALSERELSEALRILNPVV